MSHRLVIEADSARSQDAIVILDGKEIEPRSVVITLEAGFPTKAEIEFDGLELDLDVEGEIKNE